MVLYELGRDFRVSTERSTSQQMIMGVLKKMLKRIFKNKVQNELKKFLDQNQSFRIVCKDIRVEHAN